MILSTTGSLDQKPVKEYLGVVNGEAIIGANIWKDILASLRDVFGGRSASYEKVLREAKAQAMAEMQEQAEKLGANAVIGIDLDFETIDHMLIVSASGTAVLVE